MSEDETFLPFWEHFSELRALLIRSLMAILAATFLCFCFYKPLFQIITAPQKAAFVGPFSRLELKKERITNTTSQVVDFQLPKNASATGSSSLVHQVEEGLYQIPPHEFLDIETPAPPRLLLFGPLEGMAIAMKTCFWMGMALSAPLWGFFLLRFISPGLRVHERRLAIPFLGFSLVFMGAGAVLAYFITIPLANAYLQAFNAGLGDNFWSLASYLDYTFFLMLAHGIALELGLILLFLVHLRVLDAQKMGAVRKQVIVLSFILGALLTPPDVFTQIALAGLLIWLYELVLVYARFKKTARAP